nr:anoctamin-1-like [Cherax quadricarinatus]
MQPLDIIKGYFGAKVALYFSWLGFYTSMLIPASLVGVLCFIYALATVHHHQPSNDICDAGQNVTMCPLCDYHCDFWKLEAACYPAKLSYLVDNPATVFFAVFMSLWAKIFLKLWKRYSAEISHRWDLTDYNMREEPPRAEYLAKLKDVGTRPNAVTGYPEPYPPFCRMRFPRIVLSVSTVLLLVSGDGLSGVILLSVGMAGVIFLSLSVSAAPIFRHRTPNSPDPAVFSSITASLINLFCITIFNMVYTRVAVRLTEWELHRTQTEHEDSLTLKMYLLQFVNYYSSIFYIAFFKATWPGYPGDYNRIFGFRKEECEPGGCLIELSVQLATIMIGRQAINAALEMGVPVVRSWCNKMTLHSPKQPFNVLWPQWVKDFYRINCDSRSLFFEYLEMVLQFGFVTIFVASFPLAPVFALVNNLLETRLDASKFIRHYRRPAPHRGRDIGVWLKILDTVSNIAVVSNSFIIAFTSNFIPETVYRYTVSSDGSLRGFLQNSLAYFSVMDFPAPYRPQNAQSHLFCRYRAYRRAGGQEDEYQHTHLYWIILTSRLVFALVFQNTVFGLTIMVEWVISDIPSSLKEQIQKESHVANKLIMEEVCVRGVRAGYPLADGSGRPHGPSERDTCHCEW